MNYEKNEIKRLLEEKGFGEGLEFYRGNRTNWLQIEKLFSPNIRLYVVLKIYTDGKYALDWDQWGALGKKPIMPKKKVSLNYVSCKIIEAFTSPEAQECLIIDIEKEKKRIAKEKAEKERLAMYMSQFIPKENLTESMVNQAHRLNAITLSFNSKNHITLRLNNVFMLEKNIEVELIKITGLSTKDTCKVLELVKKAPSIIKNTMQEK